MGAKFK